MLSVTLKNTSTQPQSFLYDPMLQPVMLRLSGARPPFDERTRKKYDRTIYRELYQELAPGEERELLEAEIVAGEGGKYEVRWGPFRFGDVKRGATTAQAIWTSARDEWVDRDSGERGRMQGIWKGTTRSRVVEVRLP